MKLCVGLYDQSWTFVTSCQPLTLAPGAAVDGRATYAIPSSTHVQSVALYVASDQGAALTVDVDDATLGFF